MDRFEPDFEIIKMDAEIASYQEDFDPDDRGRERAPAPNATENEGTDASS